MEFNGQYPVLGKELLAPWSDAKIADKSHSEEQKMLENRKGVKLQIKSSGASVWLERKTIYLSLAINMKSLKIITSSKKIIRTASFT